MLSSFEMAQLAVKALDDKQAKDIEVLKTDKQTTLADYFVICHGGSGIHCKTLAEETDKILSEAGEPPLRREGFRSDWSLLDFGCVIVHIFTQELREFYGLERLWADAERIDYKEML